MALDKDGKRRYSIAEMKAGGDKTLIKIAVEFAICDLANTERKRYLRRQLTSALKQSFRKRDGVQNTRKVTCVTPAMLRDAKHKDLEHKIPD